MISIFVQLVGMAGNPVKDNLGFIENRGQIVCKDGSMASPVLFKALGAGPDVFVTTNGLTHIFQKKATGKKGEAQINWSRIDMVLEGAVIKKENVITSDALLQLSNFYYAHCLEGILNVKTWKKVIIKNIYPGIDWVLKADDTVGFSYDFIVHPGASPDKIKISYRGAEKINVNKQKDKITLQSSCGSLSEGALRVFDAQGRSINAAFKLKGNRISYSLGNYNKQYDLIIDPPLQWSRKEVASGTDYANSLVTPRDGSGDVILTGFAGSTDFPVANAYQGSNGGNDDIIVLRANTSGTVLWATYYGGTDFEGGKGIAADGSGNCYVAGYTNSTNFPVQNALYTNFQGGANDVALLKLNNLGQRQWATYYGSLNNDYAYAITCDLAGNSYVTGMTNSPSFPTVNPLQGTKAIAADAFIMRLTTTCTVTWATFYGGDDDDRGRGITLDAAGANLYVTGTAMGYFPVTSGVFQNGPKSPYSTEDIFVSKFTSLTGALIYATLCGGTDADIPEDIAIDNSGNAFITGYTFSADYPVFNPGGPAYVDSSLGSLATHDVFITELNPTATGVSWSTYLGGTSVDMAFGICYDPFYGIYITGSTSSTDFPVMVPTDNVFFQGNHGDAGNFYDFFIAWFGNNGAMQWSTFYGDANSNEGRSIDTDAQSNIFVCGADSNNVRLMKFNPVNMTGVTENAEGIMGIKLFPVPAQKQLTVELDLKRSCLAKLEIIDVAGRLVRSEKVNLFEGKNKLNADVGLLPAGTYLLRIVGGVEEIEQAFIKE